MLGCAQWQVNADVLGEFSLRTQSRLKGGVGQTDQLPSGRQERSRLCGGRSYIPPMVRRAEPLGRNFRAPPTCVMWTLENVSLADRRFHPAPKIPSLPDPPWEISRSGCLPLSISGYIQSSAVPRLSGARRLHSSASSSILRSHQSLHCRHATRLPCQKSLASDASRSSPPLLAPASRIRVHNVCCPASRVQSYLVAESVL